MARPKKQAEAEAPEVQADERPDVNGEVKQGEMTQAQIWKQEQIAKQKEAEAAKLAEVTARVNKEAEAYVTELHGSWIPYTDSAKRVHPAMVVGSQFKTVNEKGEKGLWVALTLLVYSSTTAQPYRAEVFY